jgi:hypothetical protein
MSRRGIISVGNRHQWPVEFWGSRDHFEESLEAGALARPLPHAPGGQPPELKFSLFPERVEDGVRSKAVDELIEKHTGRRPRRAK